MGRDRSEHDDRGPRWAVAVVAAVSIGVTAVVAEPVAADPIDDQRQRVEQLTDELEQLEETSDILAEDYVAAIDEQRGVEGEVSAAEQQVAERAAEVEQLRGSLAQVAVQSFMGAGTDGLGPMFSDSTSYTEELQRDQLARVALSAGDATTDELDHAVADLQSQRTVLEDKRTQAAEAAEQVEASKQATDEQKAEYLEARADAESQLGRLIQEEEERRARESYERQRAAEQAAAQAAEQQAQAQAEQQAQAQAAPSGGDGGGGDRSDSGGGGGEAAPPVPNRPDIPPASSRAGTAVNAALTQLGVPYQYAQSSPGVAFDCSGLTAWAWAQAGVSLPHQSAAQFGSVPHVPVEAAQPGDLLFYYSPISHVGIYLGNGQLVHAPNSGTTVKVATVNWGKVSGVGRPG